MKTVGEKIRNRRAEIRWSREQLAEATGLHSNTIAKYERDETKYGFIQLRPTRNARQEIHIIIYAFPANCPENATKTLEPMPIPEDPATEEDEASYPLQ